jgi:hypothetical protein
MLTQPAERWGDQSVGSVLTVTSARRNGIDFACKIKKAPRVIAMILGLAGTLGVACLAWDAL